MGLENGALIEKDIEAWRMEIYKAKKFELDEKKLKVFESFLKSYNLINIY